MALFIHSISVHKTLLRKKNQKFFILFQKEKVFIKQRFVQVNQ